MTHQLQLSLHGTHRIGWRLCLLLVLLLLGSFIGQYIATLIIQQQYHLTMSQLLTMAYYGNPAAARLPLLLLQITTALGAFIIAPIAYWYITTATIIPLLRINWQPSQLLPVLMTIGITACGIILNTLLIQWNATVKLPIFLQGFEQWAQQKEAAIQQLVVFIISDTALLTRCLTVIALVIIPAIGEELLFRKILQPLLQQLIKHPFVAITLTAFIFSALHQQFYGFVPRLFLGILFGYLYHWSNNLLLPMVAHGLNNASTLLLLLLAHHKVIPYDPTAVQALPWAFLLTALIVGWVLLIALKNNLTTSQSTTKAHLSTPLNILD